MVQFDARFFDGETSRAHEVRVSVDPQGHLMVVGPEQALSLPVADVRISSRLGNTTRSLTLPSGAKLETEDNDAVDRLQAQLGKRGGLSFVHYLESHWKTAALSLVMLAVVVAAGVRWGIPLAAEHVARRVPTAMAYDLGSSTLSTLDHIVFKPTQLSVEDRQRLEERFYRVSEAFPELPVQLTFRHANFPNAFALPDGTVVVTDELVKLADNDDQVLSVLCHELGHLQYRHGLRMALESSTLALLIAVYLGDATQLSALFAGLPTAYTQAHYSRSHETEADTFALQVMQKNGIAPHNFADILRKLEAELGDKQSQRGALQYLSSHPPTEERIQRFR